MLDALTSTQRTVVYHHLEQACASSGTAHRLLDQAEGAVVDGDDQDANLLAEAGLIELRRALAHMGFATVPIDDAPKSAQIAALRLIQGAAHA